MDGKKLLSYLTYLSRYSRPTRNCFNYTDSVIYLARCLGIPHRYFDEIRMLTLCDDEYWPVLFPSMRGVQFLDAVFSKPERLYNCAGILIRSPEDISNVFYLLLCGCGVGFNISRQWISDLPHVLPNHEWGKRGKLHYKVMDDVRGWADAALILLRSVTSGNDYSGYEVEFDYSGLTPRGRLLNSCDRPAPGHEPLRHALMRVLDILRDVSKRGSDYSRRLTSIEVYDIITTLASAVVAGGVRRSALLCLFDHDDDAMQNAKVGDWWKHHPNRAYANNSMIITPDIVKSIGQKRLKELYSETLERCLQYGEPGVVHLPGNDYVVNPCCEIVFHPILSHNNGRPISSYQLCNLTEVNLSGAYERNVELTAFRLASIIGTYQSAVDNLRCPIARQLHKRDRLIGVSITGAFELLYKKPREAAMVLQEARRSVRYWNAETSKHLGISMAARYTCVKPSGTVSCLAGTSSGVHPWYAPMYLRNVRFSEGELAYRVYREVTGYEGIPDSVTGLRTCAFPILAKGPSWEEVSWCDVLKAVRLVYDNYVSRDPNDPDFDKRVRYGDFTNSVSCTLLFERNDIPGLSDELTSESLDALNRLGHFRLVGLSFLGKTNNYQSELLPFCPVKIYSGEIHDKYVRLTQSLAKWQTSDLLGLVERVANDSGHSYQLGEMNGGCDSEYCVISR